jgi:predicted dehydrogenase
MTTLDLPIVTGMGAAAPTRMWELVRPRLGFLGAGWIGRDRLSALARSGLADVAAVVDPDIQAARRAAECAPEARVLGSFKELLRAGLDGVVIATPSALHAEQCVAALEAGLAVFCQKPLACSAREARLVVEAAQRADRLLGVDLSYRFTAGMRRVRQLVQFGALGEVYAARLVFHNAYGPDKSWFYDRELSGGGCLMDLGTHLVDLAQWVLDCPAMEGASGRLFARGRPLPRRGGEVEDYAVATLDFATGATAQIECSWKLPLGRDAHIEATFHGTEGGATFRNVNGSFYDFEVERFRGTTRELLVSPPDVWGGRAAVDWAAHLGAGAGFDEAAWSLVALARVLDAVYGR